MRVLIVEDEAVIRTALVALLECQGAGVVAVGSVKEGRDALETLRPDILISNFRLPDGNGAEVLKELRRHDTELGTFTPAIALSGEALEMLRTAPESAGFQLYISKPFLSQELVAAIRHLLS
jgi:DNA-binding response OmpR family regulator